MVAHRLLGEEQHAGDPTVVQAAGHQVQHFPLAVAELGEQLATGLGGESGEEAAQPGGHGGAEHRAPRRHRRHRLERSWRPAPLTTYPRAPARMAATTASSSADMVITRTVRAGADGEDLAGGLDPGAVGEVEVHQHHVRRAVPPVPRPRRTCAPPPRPPCAGVVVECGADAVEEQRVVVHQQHPGHAVPPTARGRMARTSVPPSAPRSIEHSAPHLLGPLPHRDQPEAGAASAVLAPPSGPTPLSRTSRSTWLLARTVKVARRRAGVTRDVGQRLRGDAVESHLDRGVQLEPCRRRARRPAAGGLHPAGQGDERAGQAQVVDPRRAQALADRPHLGNGSRDALARRRQQCLGGWWSARSWAVSTWSRRPARVAPRPSCSSRRSQRRSVSRAATMARGCVAARGGGGARPPRGPPGRRLPAGR